MAGCAVEALRLLFEYDKAEERIRLLLPHLKRLTQLAQAYRYAARCVLESDGEPSPLRLRRLRESLEACSTLLGHLLRHARRTCYPNRLRA
jgi:hypothetical protein